MAGAEATVISHRPPTALRRFAALLLAGNGECRCMALRTAESALAARARIRAGDHVGPTSGLAPGSRRPTSWSCPRTTRSTSCGSASATPNRAPLLEVTDTGSPHPTTLAPTPTCGPICRAIACCATAKLVDEPTDVTRYWRDDLVAFLLGCSFTFEWALAAAGLPLAHQDQGVNVPMYVTESSLRRRRADSRARWSCRCGRSPRPTFHAPSKITGTLSRHARRPGAHRRSRRARHRRSRRPRLRRPGPDRSGRGSRLLGVRRDTAGRRARRPGRRWRSSTRPATCSSPIDPTSTSTLKEESHDHP